MLLSLFLPVSLGNVTLYQRLTFVACIFLSGGCGKSEGRDWWGWCGQVVSVDNQAIFDSRERTTKGLWRGEWQPQETKAQNEGPRVKRKNLQLNQVDSSACGRRWSRTKKPLPLSIDSFMYNQ